MLTRLWHQQYQNSLYFSNQAVFSPWPKSQVKSQSQELLRWNKKHFSSFLRAIVEANNKILFERWESDFNITLSRSFPTIPNLLLFFKACAHYFLTSFCSKWKALKNYEKYFLFHLKSSFRSRDIQIFVIFSLLFHTIQN